MKILNISRYLPITGFPPVNDITLKIYANLFEQYGIECKFIMPLSHIPRWIGFFKTSLRRRVEIINGPIYIDKVYHIPIYFFQGYFGLFSKFGRYRLFADITNHFNFYKHKLYDQVRLYKPTLIHAHTIEDAFYAYKIFLKFDIPYIVTLRGFYHDIYELSLVKDILNKAKKIITPSARLKLDLEGKFDVELLPHGLDEEWFFKGDKVFNETVLRLVTVSSLIKMKNIQTVLKSISNLKNEGYKIAYDVVGEGSFEDELKAMVKELNLEEQVQFHGHLSPEKIRELYRKNDVFVMLSYPETFGRVYFEAAAQGLLIIGRKKTGLDGYFNEKEAFIIEGNEQELSKTLKNINKHKFEELTKHSRKKIMAFDNRNIIARYHRIIMENHQ